MSEIKLRRAYEKKSDNDGYRILVDRLWPRGIKKEELEYNWWPKDIAPSKELRTSFNHDTDKFPTFKKTYKNELEKNKLKSQFLNTIKTQLEKQNVTFIYGAKDKEHNQAVVLKEWVEDNLK